MNKFKRFAAACVLAEIILIIISNIVVVRYCDNASLSNYKVDISRAANEMREGKSPADIDIDKYESIINISLFEPGKICNNDYAVEDVDGILYRFEYRYENNRDYIVVMNIVLVVFLICSCFLLVYIYRKVILPFNAMESLTTKLAKGNLSVPIKEEKSKYFGSFLWGLDMLREKLEQDKVNELELVKEKKTLILSLSHDIKTPLSAIELYTKALSDNLYEDEEKREQAVAGISSNTKEIKRYVDEIARASREEFLNLSVNNKEFYLNKLIDTITDYYTEKMRQNYVDFTVECLNNCMLYGDIDRAVEVLQNIVENAVKYGDGKIIHMTNTEEEDCKLITVENSGCSLAKEELPHIFDSFYRGSNGEKGKGSGLGLYICKELMHKMDGDIYAKISGDMFAVTVVFRKI